MSFLLAIMWVSLSFFIPGANAADDPGRSADRLERITFADQHGTKVAIDEDTRLILFAPDRAAGRLLHSALAGTTRDDLARLRVVCIADISGMPSLVARFLALPKMRTYPYPLLLATVPEESKDFPRQKGLVTILQLRRLGITRTTFGSSPVEILAAIEEPR